MASFLRNLFGQTSRTNVATAWKVFEDFGKNLQRVQLAAVTSPARLVARLVPGGGYVSRFAYGVQKTQLEIAQLPASSVGSIGRGLLSPKYRPR